tara:strand:- start:137 stop:403 length:267 start_codon:yes stop_codon:yes gene_type:complete
MKSFLFFLLMLSPSLNPVLSQNNLLEKAKNNSNEGLKLCKKFKEFNSEKTSATSYEATKLVSKENNLSMVDARNYSIYVMGLYCPKIF